MKFLLDHDVPDDLAFSLEALGHEVVKLREVLPMTTPDDEVLGFATEQGRLLITCNRDDFLAVSQPVAHSGIFILMRRRSCALVRAALVRLLDSAGESGLRGNISFA